MLFRSKGNLKPDLTKIMRIAETKVSRSIDERLKKAAFKSGSNLSNNLNDKEVDVLTSLENFLNNSFPNYNPEILNNYFTLVIDITTDMKYGALEKALFNCIFIVKFFKLIFNLD